MAAGAVVCVLPAAGSIPPQYSQLPQRTSRINFLQTGRISDDSVAENIMTCLSWGVFLKMACSAQRKCSKWRCYEGYGRSRQPCAGICGTDIRHGHSSAGISQQAGTAYRVPGQQLWLSRVGAHLHVGAHVDVLQALVALCGNGCRMGLVHSRTPGRLQLLLM